MRIKPNKVPSTPGLQKIGSKNKKTPFAPPTARRLPTQAKRAAKNEKNPLSLAPPEGQTVHLHQILLNFRRGASHGS